MSKKMKSNAFTVTPGGGAEIDDSAEAPLTPVATEEESRRERIAQLAYMYWQERGCPEGSPEIDWLRAEEALQTARSAAA